MHPNYAHQQHPMHVMHHQSPPSSTSAATSTAAMASSLSSTSSSSSAAPTNKHVSDRWLAKPQDTSNVRLNASKAMVNQNEEERGSSTSVTLPSATPIKRQRSRRTLRSYSSSRSLGSSCSSSALFQIDELQESFSSLETSSFYSASDDLLNFTTAAGTNDDNGEDNSSGSSFRGGRRGRRRRQQRPRRRRPQHSASSSSSSSASPSNVTAATTTTTSTGGEMPKPRVRRVNSKPSMVRVCAAASKNEQQEQLKLPQRVPTGSSSSATATAMPLPILNKDHSTIIPPQISVLQQRLHAMQLEVLSTASPMSQERIQSIQTELNMLQKRLHYYQTKFCTNDWRWHA